MGQPLDRKGPIITGGTWPLNGVKGNVLDRGRVTEPFDLGVRAVNALLTAGRGQRIAIIAGSGVGKSVLMGQMIAGAEADIVVTGLIGERGREVSDFLETKLKNAMHKSIVVAVPAEEAPLTEDLPVATAVDEDDREALLEEDDASPSPSQSDDALSALHAFLFGGPGAKSADHWRAVGGVIASRGGVIAPEELAPHLPAPPMKLRGSEAAAAVAVAHFRGRPRRCEEGGGVVFEFPELVGGAPADGDDALCEAPVPFAGLSFERTLCCAGLVGGNVVALWVLRGAVDGALARAAAFFYYYSLAILAIPLGRFAAHALANRRRDQRNATRRALADELRRLRDEDSSGVAARVRFAARCSM